MSLGYPRVIRNIVEEHFEELDFLLEDRERIIFAPDYDLSELAEHEERVDAHQDGVCLAELHGIEIARPALVGDETFAAAAAARVFMEAGDDALAREVLDAFTDAADPAGRDGIRIGLRHCGLAPLREELIGLAGSDDAGLAVAAADLLAFQRLAVPEVDRLRGAEDPAIRALVYDVLGRTRGLASMHDLAEALEDESADVRWAALRAAARSGMAGLDELCRGGARDASLPAELVAFLGVLGGPQDRELLEEQAKDPARAPSALEALGALGQPASAPLLIELMAEEGLATHAARAFQRLSGADAFFAEAAGPPPDEEDEDEEEEDETAPVEPLTDEQIAAEFADDAPPPDPEKAAAWWRSNAERFAGEGRWQAGVEVSTAVGTPLFGALRLQTRRDLLLRALASGEPVPDIELEARAALQGA